MLTARKGGRATTSDVAAFIVILTLAIASPYTPSVQVPLGQLVCLAVMALYMIRRRERA